MKKKWFTLSFYKERAKEWKKKQERDKVGHCLWKIHQLSTQQDWSRTLFFNVNVVCFKNNPPLHMNFIPKCCCTSLKLLFLAYYYEDNPPKALNQLKNHTRNMLYTLHMTMIRYFPDYSHKTFYEKRATVKSIAFVRNPYSRLISCFRNQVASHDFQGNPQPFGISTFIPQSAKQSFESFVRFACQEPNHLRDGHFSSQWFYLTPGFTTFAFIGYCEHFSEHAHMLFSELDASEKLLHSIDTKHNSTGKYDWRDYYDEKLANLVYQAYWPDFEAFGYHKDSWKKDFEVPEMEPMRNYDPAKDIERFRACFSVEEAESIH